MRWRRFSGSFLKIYVAIRMEVVLDLDGKVMEIIYESIDCSRILIKSIAKNAMLNIAMLRPYGVVYGNIEALTWKIA